MESERRGSGHPWGSSFDAKPGRKYSEGEVIGGGLYRQGRDLPSMPERLVIGTKVAKKDHRSVQGTVESVSEFIQSVQGYKVHVKWDNGGESDVYHAALREALSQEVIEREDKADEAFAGENK